MYVQDGPTLQTLTTYSVDPTTAVATKLGSLYIHAMPYDALHTVHIFRAPKAPFLYILGYTSATEEYIWVHALTPEGVPTENPIQTLQVKPALSQFFIQPGGTFGYGMYLWYVPDKTCPHSSNFIRTFSDIVLYTVNPNTGKLTNTRKPVTSTYHSCVHQTTIYGLNQSGSRLYTQTNNVAAIGEDSYSYYDINKTTGVLTPGPRFFDFTPPSGAYTYLAISDRALALWNFGPDTLAQGIYVYPNAVVNPTEPLFFCDSSMAIECGPFPFVLDPSIIPLQFDPSGQYMVSNNIGTVNIAKLDLASNQLVDTGSSIPGNPFIVTFSPDGKLVYCAQDRKISISAFDASTGSITATSFVNDFAFSILGFSQP